MGENFTTQLIELRKLQHDDHAIKRQLATGELVRLNAEVAIRKEALNTATPWERARLYAWAYAKASDRAVLVSLSAARIYGLSCLSTSTEVELSYIRSRRPGYGRSIPGLVRFRGSRLREDETQLYDGARVTTLGRTVIDVARFHGVTEGVVAMDSALQWSRSSPESLDQYLADCSNMTGIAQARKAAKLSTGKAESALESLARLAWTTWDDPRLFSVEEQWECTLSAHLIRVDFLLNGWLIVEVDGAIKYDGQTFGRTTDEAIRRERDREKALQNAGFIVARFSYSDINGPQGARPMLRQIAALFDAYGARGPRSAA
ncbi:hypothetical protein [Corynebacterium tapiri]|uniref:DUF559 domain-containing protein n=1 Tax=Corynebacterium tapiri TaxID=1448266 RepID=A0A5C4U476_9CORY|nr:hypothetical protein [Corynebacterium tapiri]TNL97380.1 hypothetical protein FHE74_06850 [Corynebacterium tapiri]